MRIADHYGDRVNSGSRMINETVDFTQSEVNNVDSFTPRHQAHKTIYWIFSGYFLSTVVAAKAATDIIHGRTEWRYS